MNTTGLNVNVLVEIQRELISEITTLEDQLKQKKERLEDIKCILRSTCNHKWIDDTIDQMYPFKEGICIKYCEYCELCSS